MPFSDNENATEQADVAYTVTIMGGGETWRLVGCDTEITDTQGNVYDPQPIDVSNISADAAMGGGECTVRIPKTVSIKSRFMPTLSRNTYRIVIRKAWHENGQIVDSVIAFTGIIIDPSSGGKDGEELVLKCSTQMYKLNRNGIRKRYQHQCPHLVYGPSCRASETKSSFEAYLFATGNNVRIMINGDDPSRPRYFRGVDMNAEDQTIFLRGMSIEFGGRRYEIASVSKSFQGTIAFNTTPFPEDLADLVAAINATPTPRVCRVIPNCDHTLKTCQLVHDNTINFGGMPWIPFKNPIGTHFIG